MSVVYCYRLILGMLAKYLHCAVAATLCFSQCSTEMILLLYAFLYNMMLIYFSVCFLVYFRGKFSNY